MNIFIDLFSGLGGASAAFERAPNWHVIKIDNNPELLEHNRGMWLYDISDTQEVINAIHSYCNPFDAEKLVVWASPPCNQFSWARADRMGGQTADEFDLTLLESTRQIIEDLAPDYWVIENVHGAKPIFNEELEAAPTQEIGPVILWGDFPLIPIHDRANFRHQKLSAKGSRALRPNFRAMIPWEISQGLLCAIECQRSLKEWMPVEEIEEE
jgi:hypothetical protein